MDWTIPLILTHLIPYVLIPLIMWIFYTKRDYYKDKLYSQSFIQFGLICLILSMIFEFSWHAFVQNWNYTNDLHPLNGLMYFWMVVSFALISMGFLREKKIDIVLISLVVITPIAYLFGIKPIIWMAQLIALIILTINAWKILQDRLIILLLVFLLY